VRGHWSVEGFHFATGGKVGQTCLHLENDLKNETGTTLVLRKTMNDFDLILRGGTIVTHDGELAADIGIAGGKIVSLSGGEAREEIDCSGLHIFPGVIDSHVHFNEPGRTDWEGIETGSRALAAGGGTMFFDMPLNAHPPTLMRPASMKNSTRSNKSLMDFAFWGGIVPDNLDKLEELNERGVIGFKAFMADSGISFPA
jgi:allantoinase